jgi:hypothetical protein
MVPLPIVVIELGGPRFGAVTRGGIGVAVGPLAQQGLDEVLGLAIRARGVGAGAEVAQAGAAGEAGESVGDLAGAIVG